MLKCYYADVILLDEPIVYDKQFVCLDEERQRKVSRLKNEEDKKRSVLAGTLLNLALFKDGKDCGSVQFLRTQEGKPYLKDICDVSDDQYQRKYSISHSGKYACVILSDREVGIDVEHGEKSFIQNEKRFESMAKKCLAPVEWDHFFKVNTEQKKHLFLEYWTRKESYSKAIGLGMKMDFSTIDTETNKEKFFTTWMEDKYCVSIYVEDGNYEDLEIKKIERFE